MCFGSPSMPAQAALPPTPPPAPTMLDPAVVRAGEDQKKRAQAMAGYQSTVTNVGGQAGLVTPAFLSGTAGFKTLTGT